MTPRLFQCRANPVSAESGWGRGTLPNQPWKVARGPSWEPWLVSCRGHVPGGHQQPTVEEPFSFSGCECLDLGLDGRHLETDRRWLPCGRPPGSDCLPTGAWKKPSSFLCRGTCPAQVQALPLPAGLASGPRAFRPAAELAPVLP